MRDTRRSSTAAAVFKVVTVFAIMLAAAVNSRPARAADTWTVDSLGDGVANAANCPGGGGTCRLRDAIAKAASGDTIDFNVTGTITLTQGKLFVGKSLTISGPGADQLTIDAAGASRVMEVGTGSYIITLRGMTLTGGNDTVANAAGGLYGVNVSLLTLDGMAIRGNSAGDAASYNWGGGLYLTGGTFTITDTEISGNTVVATTSTSGGGGIYMNNGTLNMTNVTVSNNTASASGGPSHGGGIMLGSSANANFTNVTIQGNSSALAGGGLYVHPSAGTVSLQNSIIANNTIGNVLHGPDCEATTAPIVSQDYNLIEDTNDCGMTGATAHNLTGIDPVLDVLANNGGPTQTHALLPGSPAIGAGNDSTSPAADQRGTARPQGLHSDIGAFEALDLPDCYVDEDATAGADDGSSWGDAYLELYSALGNVACMEIWVAEGLYKPGATESDSFDVQPGVAVYGGFAGAETNILDRDWDANLTVLSGDLDDDDTDTPDGVVLDASGIVDGVSGNSDHVVMMDGTWPSVVTATTVLDGFTITAGQANNSPPDGGGLYCKGSGGGSVCSPTLAHLSFSGNLAEDSGGAVLNDGADAGESSPAFLDVSFGGNAAALGGAVYNWAALEGASSPSFDVAVFLGNNATASGGAVYNGSPGMGTSLPTFTNASFTGNAANMDGGAVVNNGSSDGNSSPSFTDVTFTNNTAGANGGAVYNDGFDGGASSPSLLRVTFTNNDAIQYGGAMLSVGGSGGISAPELTDVTITLSDAVAGGGMYNDAANPTLKGVTLSFNTATADGGGIYNDGFSGASSPEITNSTFYANEATNNGGALMNAGDSGVSSPSLKNVTFKGNAANRGGAIHNQVTTGTSNPSLINVILWGNTATTAGPEMYNTGVAATGTVSYSVVQGGCGSITGASCGAGNLSTDPLLGALANSGGFTSTMALQDGSSAVEKGSDAVCGASPVSGVDQRGIPRPQGPHCDIGAFEVEGSTIAGNAGVGAALLSYNLGGPQTASADSMGEYSFFVPDHWSGTVTPSKTGYLFTPANRVYADVTTDQLNQDYAAASQTPTIGTVFPAPNSTSCLKPQIGVRLMLADLVRTPAGAFNPSTVTLKLDGTTVTGSAVITQDTAQPVSQALILYTPPGNLGAGANPYQGSFTYPSPGGPVTYNWNFNVANQACPTSAQLTAEVLAGADAAAASSTGGAPLPGGFSGYPIQNAFWRLSLKR